MVLVVLSRLLYVVLSAPCKHALDSSCPECFFTLGHATACDVRVRLQHVTICAYSHVFLTKRTPTGGFACPSFLRLFPSLLPCTVNFFHEYTAAFTKSEGSIVYPSDFGVLGRSLSAVKHVHIVFSLDSCEGPNAYSCTNLHRAECRSCGLHWNSSQQVSHSVRAFRHTRTKSTFCRQSSIRLHSTHTGIILPMKLWGKSPCEVSESVIRRLQNTISWTGIETECRDAVCLACSYRRCGESPRVKLQRLSSEDFRTPVRGQAM